MSELPKETDCLKPTETAAEQGGERVEETDAAQNVREEVAQLAESDSISAAVEADEFADDYHMLSMAPWIFEEKS